MCSRRCRAWRRSWFGMETGRPRCVCSGAVFGRKRTSISASLAPQLQNFLSCAFSFLVACNSAQCVFRYPDNSVKPELISAFLLPHSSDEINVTAGYILVNSGAVAFSACIWLSTAIHLAWSQPAYPFTYSPKVWRKALCALFSSNAVEPIPPTLLGSTSAWNSRARY